MDEKGIGLLSIATMKPKGQVAAILIRLLALPGQVELPGMYMFSEKLLERYNFWKSKPGAKGCPHRRASKGELQASLDNVDFQKYVPGTNTFLSAWAVCGYGGDLHLYRRT